MPFSDSRLLSYLQHTYWFLPSVAACRAMSRLLRKKTNRFFDDYKVVVAAGSEAGMGAQAVEPVYDAMEDPQRTRTITLSCGKLSTGVTVRPWTGILMLRNTTSPETYFQAAFRVQSPWTIKDERGEEVILKPFCYVFDFAPNRALRQVAEYSCRLNVHESNPERKVDEFIKFLPILAFDGSSMKEIDAAGVLDMAMSGTTATLLARRWESAVLVNVDNATLQRLMNSPEAMRALMNIEGFRNLNSDIETIINKSEHVKNTKKEKGDGLSASEKKRLSEEEKEFKSKRKEIQEKLIKFATRIPVFMYLTDFREYCLKDVIEQLEPELFRKVTGLTLRDFSLLVSLGVFNSELMNDAVYKFKRYEDSSLEYTGIDRHSGTMVGLWDTTVDTSKVGTAVGRAVDSLKFISTKNRLIDADESCAADTLPTDAAEHVENRVGRCGAAENLTTDASRAGRQEKTLPLAEKDGESTLGHGSSAGEAFSHKTWNDIKAGDSVTHKSLGPGTVIFIDDNYLTVRFSDRESKFHFPSAFEKGYLSV